LVEFFPDADIQPNKALADSKFDHRLFDNLKKSPQLQQTNNLVAGQDFMAQHNLKASNGKPHIVSQKQAFNMFQKEQSVLGEDGIIKRKAETNFNTSNVKTDSLAKEKVVASSDGANIVKNESVDLNNVESISAKPRVETSVSMASASTDTKVIDLSNVQSKEQVISEITKYIETSKVQNSRELDLVVTHKELGQFRVNASRSGGEMVDLKIMTTTNEANNFFNQNETNLLRSLASSGVKVSDIRISMSEANAHASGNDSAGQNNSGNGSGSARNYSGGDNSQNQGRQRRNELWENYRERLGA
jgi:hypothetical protein